LNPKALDPAPSVAVVILNWNGRSFLEQFLPSVVASTYPNLKVVLADNASTDDSLDFVRTRYPQVGIVVNPTNEGFSRGYNTALSQVEADIFVLLNSDVEVPPGWIEPAVACFADPKVAAVQPKMLEWSNRTRLEYAGAAGGWIDSFGYPFCRGRIFEYNETDKGQYDDIAPIFWASGAALFIRSAVFRKVGGFDPFFFAHQEEIDLCWRIQLAGYRILACPASVIYHVGGGTLPKGNTKKVFLNFRNNLIMLWKNLPMAQRIWKIPFRIALDAVSGWKNLLGGEPHFFWAVVKAHWAFARWLLFHRAESPFPKERRWPLPGVYAGNLIWDHFILKKNRFSDIVDVEK
jgi:GT2 family glycosyltransferase